MLSSLHSDLDGNLDRICPTPQPHTNRIFPEMAPEHGDQGQSDAPPRGAVQGGFMQCLAGEAVGQHAGHASQRWDGDCAGRWMVVGALLASGELAAWAALLTAGVLIVSRVHMGRE